MRFLTAFACLLLLAGCGSSDDGTRSMDTGTSAIADPARVDRIGTSTVRIGG